MSLVSRLYTTLSYYTAPVSRCYRQRCKRPIDSQNPSPVPLDVLPNIVIIANKDGKIVDINKIGREILKCEKNEILGTNIKGIIHGANEANQVKSLRKFTIKTGNIGTTANNTITIIRKDGSTFPAKIAITKLRTPKQETQLIATIIDMTAEQKKLRAEEMNSCMILHDTRGPLAIIQHANAELLDMEELPTNAKSLISSINLGATTLDSLVNHSLDIAKLLQGDTLPLTDCYLMDHIQKLIALNTKLAEVHGKKIEFIITIPEKMRCSIAIEVLHVVIYNLISNAFKFTPKNSTTPIRCEFSIDPMIGRVGTRQLNLCFKVQNEGPGFSEQQKARMFTPYMQASPLISASFGGTGLGLSKSRTLLERVNGALDATSVPKQLTTFFGTLPFKAVNTLAIQEPRELKIRECPKPANVPKCTILYVEDSDLESKMTKRTLTKLGHSVVTATDPDDAMRKYQTQQNTDKPFNLVITDMYMGESTGLDLAKTLRSPQHQFKGGMILLSGTVNSETTAEASAVGINQCVIKGRGPEQLQETIGEVMQPDSNKT
jgi:PAS domain S-box-containing protein